MRVSFSACSVVLCLLLTLSQDACGDEPSVGNNWPQFRGRFGNGISSGRPPTEWDVKTGRNVAWKTPIPGLGHSSPIVWEDRVFLTTAVNSETDEPSLETGWLGGSGKSAPDSGEWTWQTVCLSLSSGKILWARDALAGKPRVKRHLKASHANCTPATDGTHVVSFFGSEGLHCFDFEGRVLWQKDFGRLHSGPYDEKLLEWGFASSPIIYDGKVIVQCDCLNTAFIAVLDIATGEEVGRIDREDEVSTWSTPLVIETDDGPQLICNGYRQMAGYNLNTSQKLWHLNGGGDVPVPSPQYAGGLIYLTNSHGRTPIYAVEPSASGDITPKPGQKVTPAGLAWWRRTDGAYMPTPLVLDGLLYVGNDNGRLAVCDAKNGDLKYRQRVGSGSRVYSASAVAGGDHLYYCSERGEVTVIRRGEVFEKVASNEMAEVIMATPAISGDRLLIRTVSQLICLKDGS